MLKTYNGSVELARQLTADLAGQWPSCDTDKYWDDGAVRAFGSDVLDILVFSLDGFTIALGISERLRRAPSPDVAYKATVTTVRSYERESDGRTCYILNRASSGVTDWRTAEKWLADNMPEEGEGK